MPDAVTLDRYLTVSEVANHLRVSRLTVYRLIRSKKIASIMLNGSMRRIARNELLGYIGRMEQEAAKTSKRGGNHKNGKATKREE